MTNEKKAIGELLKTPTKKTMSEISYKQSLNDNCTDNLEEIAKSRMPAHEKNLHITLERGLKDFPGRDFYIYTNHKRELALSKVIRHLWGIRLTCPRPCNEQTAYKYHYKDERLEFLWSVPNSDVCRIFYNNPEYVGPEDYDVLRTVIDFRDGGLYRKALELDGLLY